MRNIKKQAEYENHHLPPRQLRILLFMPSLFMHTHTHIISSYKNFLIYFVETLSYSNFTFLNVFYEITEVHMM